MDGELKVRSDILAENAALVAKKYRLDYRLMALGGAFTYLNSGSAADEAELDDSKRIMRDRLKLFSGSKAISSSSYLKCVIACKMAQCANPEEFLDNVNCAWGVLSKHFSYSIYLGNAAYTLATCCKVKEYEAVALKAKEIYKLNKHRHFLITNGKDISECILQAMTSMSAEELVNNSEECFKLLKKNIRKADSAQSMAFISTVFNGTNEDKCDDIIKFYRKLKDEKVKISSPLIQPFIALPALCGVADDNFVDGIKEVEQYFKRHKNLKMFGLNMQQRYMLAISVVMTSRLSKIERDVEIKASILQETVTNMLVEQVIAAETEYTVTAIAAVANS
ncbi:MAG: DUF4003 domain-containing protein [Clostridia bacterium]|nr:DUF4003 domain-containing protein [Clostridia bacterium]